MITKQVSSTVYQPSEMKDKHVSQSPSHKECRPETLPPKLYSNLSGEYEAHVKSKPRVQLLLEHDYRILMQITKVQFLPSTDHLGVLLNVQPTHVSVEESTHGIVWVGIRLGIFVVDTVVTCPVVDGSLVGDGVAKHEGETDGEGGGVGSV